MAGKITDYAAATTGAATDLMEVATDIGGTPTSKKISLLNLINSLFGLATTKLGLALGGTNADLSATGAATHFLAQASAGAAVTVRAIAGTDLGLPASVNVLGNHSAAGEFVQRGSIASATTDGAFTAAKAKAVAVTFAVAFSAAPIVIGGGTTSAKNVIPSIYSIATTGFIYNVISDSTDAAANVGWLALGA